MNISDVDPEIAWNSAVEQYKTEDPVELIFARQLELTQKYLPIEARLLGKEMLIVPLDLDSPIDQTELKQRAWWVVEELAEFAEAARENPTKALEELSDALHFATELLILAGLGPSDFVTAKKPSMVTHWAAIVETLGLAMWQLRNKPWKVSQIPTDRARFKSKLIWMWCELFSFVESIGALDARGVALLYLEKSLVNHFRIRSSY